MKSPFKYGMVVTGHSFINRTEEIERIQQNISAGIHTIIISPKRWGKSSLLKQVALTNRDKGVKFAFIDFFNIRTGEDFLEKYSAGILRSGISKSENFSWKEVQKKKGEIINLPERIARRKGIKMVVCIDEFQSISRLKDHLALEQELRSNWQNQESTCYCLNGSRKHEMMEIFNAEPGAFYRFGDIILLEKIPEQHWVKHIKKSFKDSGKNIRKELIKRMIQITNNHPDYIQQLCHNVWNATESESTPRIIDEAMDLVVRSNALHYNNICDSLSNTQLNLVYAILAGESQLTAAQTMQKYKLGTPHNVSKNKKTLEEKDIVEIHGDSIGFNDPVFEHWLRTR